MARKTMDGYVRVSRVGGREGESFISPSVQRETIERLARAKGVKLAEVIEELDVSGAKDIDKRELGRLVRKVEAGQSDGIIVWRLSRFSRSLIDAVTVSSRITQAGGRLLADDFDSSAPMSKAFLGFLAGFAEEERDQRRVGWQAAVSRATKRGIHVGPTPTGYKRESIDPNTGKARGRLVVDKKVAHHIKQAFHMRVEGYSLQQIADYLEKHSVQPNARKRNGNGRATHAPSWSRSGVKAMTGSRVYVGEAFHGDDVQKDAHEAIVSDDLWQLAQVKHDRPPHDGSVAQHGLLLGIAGCASCGRPLAMNASGPQDNRQANYYCRDPKRNGCDAPAAMNAARVHALVEPELRKRLKRKPRLLSDAENRASIAIHAWEDAEAELEAFLKHASVRELGENYGPEVSRRREAVVEALRYRDEVMNAVEAFDYLPNPGAWDEVPIKEKRCIANTIIESVTIVSADPKRGRWQPTQERVQVTWR